MAADSRDGVDTTGMPGMAFRQAPHSHPRASNDTVGVDGFKGVLGTGGVKAAVVAEHWAEQELVDPDQAFDDGAHLLLILCQWAFRLALISGLVRLEMPDFAITTRSTGGIEPWFRRKDSRTSLFTLFLEAASPAALIDTARPRRAFPWVRGFASTVNKESEDLTDRWKTSSKSAFDFRRRSAPKREELSAEMAGSVLELWNLRGQPSPALGPPAGQDLATILRSHPCPEAMGALAAQIARLEGALHCSALRSCFRASAECRPREKGPES